MVVSVKIVMWTGCLCALTTGLLTYQAGRRRQQLDLSSTKAPFAVLTRAQLSNAKLTNADFRQADLYSADLEHSDLRAANLQHANLILARLRGAALSGADLRAAALGGADLVDADIRGAFYDEDTMWPDRFDPDAAGAIRTVRLDRGPRMSPAMAQYLLQHQHLEAHPRPSLARE